MRIAKRISFSLDEFLAQWCCRRHAVRRSDVISPGMVNFPGPNGGAPLYLNRQKRVNTILRKSACKGLPALPNRRAVAFVASVRQLALSAQAKWVRAGKKAPIT